MSTRPSRNSACQFFNLCDEEEESAESQPDAARGSTIVSVEWFNIADDDSESDSDDEEPGQGISKGDKVLQQRHILYSQAAAQPGDEAAGPTVLVTRDTDPVVSNPEHGVETAPAVLETKAPGVTVSPPPDATDSIASHQGRDLRQRPPAAEGSSTPDASSTTTSPPEAETAPAVLESNVSNHGINASSHVVAVRGTALRYRSSSRSGNRVRFGCSCSKDGCTHGPKQGDISLCSHCETFSGEFVIARFGSGFDCHRCGQQYCEPNPCQRCARRPTMAILDRHNGNKKRVARMVGRSCLQASLKRQAASSQDSNEMPSRRHSRPSWPRSPPPAVEVNRAVEPTLGEVLRARVARMASSRAVAATQPTDV